MDSLNLNIVEKIESKWTDEEIVSMHLDGLMSPYEIAQKVNSSRTTIIKRLEELDAYIPDIYRTDFPISEDEFKNLHVEKKYSISKIVSMFDEPKPCLGRWVKFAKKNGFYRGKTINGKQFNPSLPISKEKMEDLHVNKNMTIAQIFNKYDDGNSYYHYWIKIAKDWGIYRGHIKNNKYSEVIKWDDYDIKYLYKYTEMPIVEIAKKYKTTVALVIRKLKELDIHDWRERKFIDKQGRSISRKYVIYLYEKKGWTIRQLHKKLGRSRAFYMPILEEAKVYKPEKPSVRSLIREGKKDPWDKANDKILREMYLEQEHIIKDIKKQFPEVPMWRLKSRIRETGLETERADRRRKVIEERNKNKELVQGIIDGLKSGKGAVVLSKQFKVPQSYIYKIRDDHDIKYVDPLDAIGKEELRKMYEDDKMSLRKIGKLFGNADKAKVKRRLINLGIEIRSKKQQLSILAKRKT